MLKKLGLFSLVSLVSCSALAERVKVQATWNRKHDEIIKVVAVDEDNTAMIEYLNGITLAVTVRAHNGQAAMDVIVFFKDDAGNNVEHTRTKVIADWGKEAPLMCADKTSKESLSVTAIRV